MNIIPHTVFYARVQRAIGVGMGPLCMWQSALIFLNSIFFFFAVEYSKHGHLYVYNKFCMILRVGGIGDCAYLTLVWWCWSIFERIHGVVRAHIAFAHYWAHSHSTFTSKHMRVSVTVAILVKVCFVLVMMMKLARAVWFQQNEKIDKKI